MGLPAGGEGQEYEEVDVGVGGVGVSDPTYMEVGEGNTFQLKENEAYANCKLKKSVERFFHMNVCLSLV
jgi:hypothetical protein